MALRKNYKVTEPCMAICTCCELRIKIKRYKEEMDGYIDLEMFENVAILDSKIYNLAIELRRATDIVEIQDLMEFFRFYNINPKFV